MRIVIASIVMMSLLACNREKVASNTTKPDVEEQVEINEEPIIGAWKWDSTRCCGRTNRLTTDTMDYDRILRFKDDGVVEYYQDIEFQRSAQYELLDKVLQDDREGIKLDNIPYPALLTFDGNKMIINYGYMDLQIEYYSRVED